MGLFAVTTNMKTKAGDQVWYPFEIEGVETIEDLYKHLDDRGIVLGDRLKVRRDREGWLHETERDKLILGVDMVGQVSVMNPERLLRRVEGLADIGV